MLAARRSTRFYGWRVVWAAFTLAVFGWGVGFYGPPVFLHAVHAGRGWPLALVSAAVTLHFLVGAVSVTNLPALHRRFGVAGVTKASALAMAIGVCGWAMATAPWQLFAATLLTGFGWSGMSAAAINAIVSPWFVRTRPAALAMAYNGGSIGGAIFSPLWVAAIQVMGFPIAAATLGAVMPATPASSEAVRARPSIKACSIPARAGSPARAAILANVALLAMVQSSAVLAASWMRHPPAMFRLRS